MNRTDREVSPRTKDGLALLSAGIQGILQKPGFQGWTEFLTFLATRRKYSARNMLMIYYQKPDATAVASYKTWQKAGRNVRAGEKALTILAPIFARQTEEEKAENRPRRLVGFKGVPVFDISQTDGPEIVSAPVSRLQGDDFGILAHMIPIAEKDGWTVTFKSMDGIHSDDLNGWCDYTGKQIVVREGLFAAQSAKTLAHEIGHKLLHEGATGMDRGEKELEAESVAFLVLHHFGIDAGDYSFGYIAGWAGDEAEKTLQRNASRVLKAANEIIDAILAATAEATEAEPVEAEAEGAEAEPVMEAMAA